MEYFLRSPQKSEKEHNHARFLGRKALL